MGPLVIHTERERENARVGLAPGGPRKQAGGGGGERGVSGLRPGFPSFFFFFFSGFKTNYKHF
jgi:hypothetical protein